MDSTRPIQPRVLDDVNKYKINYYSSCLLDYNLPDLFIHHVHPSWRPTDYRRLSDMDMSESEREMLDLPRLPSIYSPDWKTKKYWLHESKKSPAEEQPNSQNELDNDLEPLRPPNYYDNNTPLFADKSFLDSINEMNPKSNQSPETTRTQGKYKMKTKHISFAKEASSSDGSSYELHTEEVSSQKKLKSNKHNKHSSFVRDGDGYSKENKKPVNHNPQDMQEGDKIITQKYTMKSYASSNINPEQTSCQQDCCDSGDSADISSTDGEAQIGMMRVKKILKGSVNRVERPGLVRGVLNTATSSRAQHRSQRGATYSPRAPPRDTSDASQSPLCGKLAAAETATRVGTRRRTRASRRLSEEAAQVVSVSQPPGTWAGESLQQQQQLEPPGTGPGVRHQPEAALAEKASGPWRFTDTSTAACKVALSLLDAAWCSD